MKIFTTPYVTSDGLIQSLRGLAEDSKAKISGNKPTGIGDRATVQSNASLATMDVVASMGFGSMFELNASGNTVFFMQEIKTSELPIPGAADSIVSQEYYGVSIRICIKAWGFKADTKLDLGVMAAEASAGAASVAYQVDVLGIRTSDLISLPGLISGSLGPFDVTKLQAVGAVASDLATLIATAPETCQPELLAVDIDLSQIQLPYCISPSAMYGLGQIASGLSYTDVAGKELPPVQNMPPIDLEFVKRMYEGLVDSTKNPPNLTQQETAKDIIKVGKSSGC